MITYKIEDTENPEYKTAVLYSEEDIDLFLSFDIHGAGTQNPETSVTIHTNEEIVRHFSKKTNLPLHDLVAEGRAEGYIKYLVLKLDSNITLLHAKPIKK